MMEGKVTDESQAKQIRSMDCDIGHKSSNADRYRPLAEETESQPGVTIEEIMQKMREREIEILLRAGFPEKDDDKLETISIIFNTTCSSTLSISETESESDSDFTTVTEIDTSLSDWSLAEDKAEYKVGEVASLTGETDEQESMTSFTKSLFCFPCCFKEGAPLAHTKKQNGKRPSLFRRFRNFLQRTLLRRGHQ